VNPSAVEAGNPEVARDPYKALAGCIQARRERRWGKILAPAAWEKAAAKSGGDSTGSPLIRANSMRRTIFSRAPCPSDVPVRQGHRSEA
jgi:hypothetical protein